MSAEAPHRRLLATAAQFGFARRVTVGGRSGRAAQQQSSRDALFPQPTPLATDDTPLALGQVHQLQLCPCMTCCESSTQRVSPSCHLLNTASSCVLFAG